MNAPHIISFCLPSFGKKLLKLVEMWQSSGKIILRSFRDTIYQRYVAGHITSLKRS